jgi:thymidylate kinase
MAIIVFVLGRSGSGKSTSVRYLVDGVKRRGWSVACFNDYHSLRKMYAQDAKHERFRPSKHDGFVVTDASVFNEALHLLEQEVRDHLSLHKETLVTIEFTSNDYEKALQLFSKDFLQNVYYLFLASDLLTCINRIIKRFEFATSEDDYFVSDEVLFKHFPQAYMPFRIGEKEAKIIWNLSSKDELQEEIEAFVQSLPDQDMETKESELEQQIRGYSEKNHNFELVAVS